MNFATFINCLNGYDARYLYQFGKFVNDANITEFAINKFMKTNDDANELFDYFKGENGEEVSSNKLARLRNAFIAMLLQFAQFIDWEFLLANRCLPEKCMTELALADIFTEYEWYLISKHANNFNLSEDFLSVFADKIHWNELLKHRQISDGLLRSLVEECEDHIDWKKELGEDKLHFLEQFASLKNDTAKSVLVDMKNINLWALVSKYQPLTDQFVVDYSAHIDWDKLAENEVVKLSARIILAYCNTLKRQQQCI